MSKNISELSIVELKALCYDHFVNIENSQKTIQALNAELVKRQTETKDEVVI